MLCRVCLLEASEILGIFEDLGEQCRIAELIKQHLFFKPEANDNITTHICVVCWKMLKDFHKFYENVEKAQKQYEEIVRKVTTKSVDTTNEKLEKPNCSRRIKEEEFINDEYDEKIMQMDIENQENTLADDMVNTEQHNPLEYLNEESEFDSDDTSGHGEDDYEPLDISELLELQDDDPQIKDSESKEKRARKKRKSLEGCFASKKTSKKIKQEKEKKQRIYINKTDPAVTDTLIEKHIPMGCQLCIFVGKQFTDIVEHFRNSHPKTRPFIICCDKRFTKRFYIAQHALKHEDPNCFRCIECNKSFTTHCGLRIHNSTFHAPEEELIFACDQCPKRFARRNLLEIHIPSHIPKEQWSFVCSLCPERNAFCSKYLLNIHTSMRHKKTTNVCHVCAKNIKDKHSFEKHVRSHFEDIGPRIKCTYPDCESWLKDEDSLKQHLKRHNPNGEIFKCEACGKLCKNRRALTSHKSYSHSNEIFKCEYCEKTFKKSITLREHMTQHTGGTLYKCPFCTKTFNSNANMHSHKKKQHPVEWSEWRKSKRGSAQTLIQNDFTPLPSALVDDLILSNVY